MEEQRIAKAHKLVVNNRKTSTVTGVLDVLQCQLPQLLRKSNIVVLIFQLKNY